MCGEIGSRDLSRALNYKPDNTLPHLSALVNVNLQGLRATRADTWGCHVRVRVYDFFSIPEHERFMSHGDSPLLRIDLLFLIFSCAVCDGGFRDARGRFRGGFRLDRVQDQDGHVAGQSRMRRRSDYLQQYRLLRVCRRSCDT